MAIITKLRKRNKLIEELKQAILEAKEKGISDQEIGKLFGISYKQLQNIITQAYGVNISNFGKLKKIKAWGPKNFTLENTTLWGFKNRGNWVTHDGRYRGNWSPYIPRNVILRYTSPGDVVLDFFVGSGTTAIEAKLLGRRCIAIDINPACVKLTLENLNFKPPVLYTNIYEPEVKVGDARDLSSIPDNSIDLICAHPPYAGIIKYSTNIEGDLSNLNIEDFLKEMEKVASESYRVLKPGKKCVILIGDARKNKYVVPIGFRVIDIFLKAGFRLKELVIKRQYNCKTTGFWYTKSLKYNFLLLAHEYLPIFEKPLSNFELVHDIIFNLFQEPKVVVPEHKYFDIEITTVWNFPKEDFEIRLNRNVVERYSDKSRYLIVIFDNHSKDLHNTTNRSLSLLYIKVLPSGNLDNYLENLKEFVRLNLSKVEKGGFLVIQSQDVRVNGYIYPTAKKVFDVLNFDNLWLKEIVIVVYEDKESTFRESLKIVHQYLLVYEVKK